MKKYAPCLLLVLGIFKSLFCMEGQPQDSRAYYCGILNPRLKSNATRFEIDEAYNYRLQTESNRNEYQNVQAAYRRLLAILDQEDEDQRRQNRSVLIAQIAQTAQRFQAPRGFLTQIITQETNTEQVEENVKRKVVGNRVKLKKKITKKQKRVLDHLVRGRVVQLPDTAVTSRSNGVNSTSSTNQN